MLYIRECCLILETRESGLKPFGMDFIILIETHLKVRVPSLHVLFILSFLGHTPIL